MVHPTEPLAALTNAVRGARQSGDRWATNAIFGVTAVVALLVARQGTVPSRLGAAAALVVTAIAAIAWGPLVARRLGDTTRLLRGPVARIDEAAARRALRALTLVPAGAVATEGGGATAADGTSTELARLHVARAVAAIPAQAVIELASRRAWRVRAVAIAAALAALAVALMNAAAIVEGADVLVARAGVAPVPLPWLDDVEVTARPPEYLHQDELHEIMLGGLVLPYGTAIAVRGTPNRAGRKLYLSDGTTEVPFVDDGARAVVARWSLTRTVTLRVVARFGDVVIPAPESLPVKSVPDAVPEVALDTAPRLVRLIDATENIPIRYRAIDDHGLREVQLVLRSGTREERRVLAHLDGETRSFQGGNVLTLRDPFVTKSHVPVAVTVEAEDNDPLTGPKWGASPAITLVPPDVGQPEAMRLAGLRVLRDALVDTLASRVEGEPPQEDGARREAARQALRRAQTDDARAEVAVNASYGGITVSSRIRALLGSQREATLKAAEAEARAPTDATRAAALKATEHFVLVLDAVIHGLSVRDARASAKLLADVADDLAAGAGQMRNGAADARSRGGVRVDAAFEVLRAGGRAMHGLGDLGRDLGEIVGADLARVRRAASGEDFAHAELAARDLAARLRQPDPSFGSRGSGRGQPGGESGNPDPESSAAGGDGEGGEGADDVQQAFNEAVQDLERLAQDHAGEISQMERALAGAENDEETRTAKEDARRHAEAIREAARHLPPVGMGSDSWTSKGAAARDLADQMARSLEDGRPEDAAESGRSAVGSLDEAKKMLQRGGWLDDPQGAGQKAVDDARHKLEAEARWAEDQVKEMHRRAAERARDQLRRGGEDEDRLADRARELSEKGRQGASFPQQAVESLESASRAARQAAEALKSGDADRGLDRQHEAQRELESARQQLQDDDNSGQPSGGEGDGSAASHDPVAIPDAKEHKGPEEFRRRVVRGLGQRANGGLRDAVQRYAEGLLR